MPIFTLEEYARPGQRPSFEEAWDRLPVLRTWDGIRVRWLGPLVDLAHDVWLEDMAQAAWGYLEGCGWVTEYEEGGPMLDAKGRVRKAWMRAFGRAVRILADAGRDAGPESDPDRWGSWLAFSLTEPRAVVERAARLRGAIR
ncbi:MAG: hypothetical protein JXB39_07555 [Deltaproteobacteria bacterium]|nr:hypothetical protein [Deltaproteobacteria bacterium]